MGDLYVITSRNSSDGQLAPLGARDEILRVLAERNTAPEAPGQDVLYGPGFRIELPPGDPVTQMLMTIVEEEIAFHVIQRFVREMPWRFTDPVSGRSLPP